MPTLHLGVVDLPYQNDPEPTNRPRKKKTAGGPAVTTGDVAEWLERKYHVMEHFAELHMEDVVALALENSLQGALESVLMGAPTHLDPFGGATSAIEDAFKRFLSQKELDQLGYPGIPTRASIEGISRRFKSRRNPGRPSFVDTGLMATSFRAWVE